MKTKTALRFAGGYGLSVAVSGVVSLAVIPAIIVAAGADAWATIAVAQAVAGFAFVFAVYGWGVVGPTEIASRTRAERGAYFYDSLLSRFWLCIVVVPIAIVVAIVIVGHDYALAALTVSSGVLVALGAGWFYVGEASPIRFLLIDTLPRIAGTVLGAIVLIATGDVIAFAAMQLLGVLAAAVIASWNILARHRDWRFTLSPIRAVRNLAGQASPVAMSATSSVYVNVPIVLIDLFLPQATAVYALAERIVRLALYSTRPVVQVAQGWVPNPDPVVQASRARRVTVVALGLGVLGGLVYGIAGPWIGELLSGGTLVIPFALAIPMAVNLAAILASQLTGFACLTAYGLTKPLATSTIVGAIVGTLLMYPLLLWIGAPGVAWGLGIAELCVLAVQLLSLAPRIRRRQPVGF
ncbi:lipopolysaccharide biosynthesis protein [Agromyces sp. NPDC058104]|uniref:lipopolysaccharide biosynthesis protein n=1 Tax=Agromyces sp. NPDC058104 TaxID=3346342 RepID=UPI0036DAB969